MTDLLLTPDEIQDLTGYEQPKRQIRALRDWGIRVFERPDGSPAVLRRDLEPDRASTPPKTVPVLKGPGFAQAGG